LINKDMQVKIFINDKLYKTVSVDDPKSYNPNQYWSQIQADKEAGLLESYNIENKFSVRFEPVK
jgi:hypothetical protein